MATSQGYGVYSSVSLPFHTTWRAHHLLVVFWVVFGGYLGFAKRRLWSGRVSETGDFVTDVWKCPCIISRRVILAFHARFPTPHNPRYHIASGTFATGFERNYGRALGYQKGSWGIVRVLWLYDLQSLVTVRGTPIHPPFPRPSHTRMVEENF